jgi:eukaryotic-like serine/threonine-protein kinase
VSVVVADDVFRIVGSVQAEVFRVTAVVAEGGFAVVYRAHHQGFRAEVALKCLKVPTRLKSEQKATFLRKFQEEGELLFRLSALMPPIVRPLHVGVIDSPRSDFVPFIALEWLDGESLTDVVRRRRDAGKPPLDLKRAVRLLGPAARALERAHAFPAPEGTVSVIHRDMKPDNVFIAKIHGQEQVKVLDFGISKVKTEAAQIAGQVSSVQDTMSAFTPAYGSPEQWLPKRFGQTGSWTDVWGLALTLVETISGRQPLEGDMHAVLAACVDEKKRPTPRNLGIILPDAIEALFVRALAVEPQHRFAKVGEFWDPLEAAVGVQTPRFGVAVSALESILPMPMEYETTLPGGFALGPLAGELVIDSEAAAIPDLELETSAPAKGSNKKTMMHRRSELPLMGNEIPMSAIREVKLIEPVRTALEVDMSAPVPSRRRMVPVVSEPSKLATRALMSQLGKPIRLIVLAVLLMMGDFVYTLISGQAISLGPVRIFWIAGPMAGVGLIWLLRTLIAEGD